MALFSKWQWVPMAMENVLQVRGEYYHSAGISAFVKRNGNDVTATFTHEPDNEYDRNAVRVDLIGASGLTKCGYIPAELAASWVPIVTRAARNRHRLFVDARVDRDGQVWLGPKPWR